MRQYGASGRDAKNDEVIRTSGRFDDLVRNASKSTIEVRGVEYDWAYCRFGHGWPTSFAASQDDWLKDDSR